jgi:hypothetical protein
MMQREQRREANGALSATFLDEAIRNPSSLSPRTQPPPTPYIVPAMVAAAGDQASWRYLEFFTANINNDHTRRAYTRACSRFFTWCEERGLTLAAIRPFDLAAWVKELGDMHSAPGVKQQLAAVRMLFDWLIIGQVMPMNRPRPCAGRTMS